MRKLLTTIALIFATLSLFAQAPKMKYTEASELTIFGKVFQDTPNPYERMDFTRFGGWAERDIQRLTMSSGIIVSFKTDSPIISVKAVFNEISPTMASGFAARGFDLYIKKDGMWLWAGCCAYGLDKAKENGQAKKLVENMDSSLKECIMYLPTYSKMASVQVGVVDGSRLEKGEVPFRHRICLHGSSFIHGSGTGRAGQTVPGYLTRKTGMQFCSLGVGGNCHMQPQYANALKDADVDAFVFDAFSNGSASTIEKRLFNFIETIQSGKPGVPLIFMKTIWRERRNFNQETDAAEAAKEEVVDKLMKEAVKKYKDVYYVTATNATSKLHDTTMDGTHPGDWGYYLWAESVRKPICKILAKYGIK